MPVSLEQRRQWGFRWLTRSTEVLPDESTITIVPSDYKSSMYITGMSDRQQKYLRLYTVIFDDGTNFDSTQTFKHEAEIERLLGETPEALDD